MYILYACAIPCATAAGFSIFACLAQWSRNSRKQCVCVCVAAVHYTRVYTYAPTLCYIRARAFWLLRPIIINGVQKWNIMFCAKISNRPFFPGRARFVKRVVKPWPPRTHIIIYTVYTIVALCVYLRKSFCSRRQTWQNAFFLLRALFTAKTDLTVGKTWFTGNEKKIVKQTDSQLQQRTDRIIALYV